MKKDREHIVILGAQFGDEGKAKVIDHYINEAVKDHNSVLVYRWQGGSNAGHTVKVEDIEYKFHLIPAGVLSDNTFNLLAHDVYVNPVKLLKEIEELREKGIKISNSNFGISGIVHVTLDYHTNEDSKNFNLKEHSSTGSGIAQTARDKYSREGIRLVDFLDEKIFREIIEEKIYGKKAKNEIQKFVDSYAEARELLKDYLVLESDIFNDKKYGAIIGEGAQGFGLDVNYGLYPGTTSTSPFTTIRRPTKIIGVFKAYMSSVGIKNRPFVTEIKNKDLSEKLVDLWDEYGTTTGKPRHVGWFDVPFAKYAIGHDLDEIIITNIDKLDLLFNLTYPRIVIGYDYEGVIYDNWNSKFLINDNLKKVIPVEEEIRYTLGGLREKNGVSLNGIRYIERLEELLDFKFTLVGNGPDRYDIVERSSL